MAGKQRSMVGSAGFRMILLRQRGAERNAAGRTAGGRRPELCLVGRGRTGSGAGGVHKAKRRGALLIQAAFPLASDVDAAAEAGAALDASDYSQVAAVALLPPLLVLIAGLALGWVYRGFRAP